MSDPFLGEIRLFGFNFAPRGWANCNGALVATTQNPALFALLGTSFGGNGNTNFALPDFRGRVPIQIGNLGQDLYEVGSKGGVETVTLTAQELPQHNHDFNASAEGADRPSPGSKGTRSLAISDSNLYGGAANLTTMNQNTSKNAGGGEPHYNMQPYLATNFCIATAGEFPPRD